MLKRLNHVAIAVPDLVAGAAVYRDLLGAKVSAPQPEPDHGVTVVFVELGNTKIELLEPLGEASPIAKFLASNPAGGIHHICATRSTTSWPPAICPKRKSKAGALL
jgi:methylmalonyl-CoA/ethylmalonyl-CoA epimerase